MVVVVGRRVPVFVVPKVIDRLGLGTRIRPPLYGGEPMGEKLPLRSLDDVEGEVGFHGARTRPLVLLLKELGGPKDCKNNWVSGRGMKNNGKKWGKGLWFRYTLMDQSDEGISLVLIHVGIQD